MNLKNKTQSTEIESINTEYLKRIYSHFKILLLFSKLIPLIFAFFVFICRIYSRSLSISCAIIVVFSIRIFRNLDLGIEWVLRCKANELESLRYIVSRLERVVVERPTYALFSLETQSPKGTFERSRQFG